MFSFEVVYQLPASRFVTTGKGNFKLILRRKRRGDGRLIIKLIQAPEGLGEERDYRSADSAGRRRRAGRESHTGDRRLRPSHEAHRDDWLPPPLEEFRGSRVNGGTGQSSASITH